MRLGIYRAWIEIVFVGSFVDFPSAHFATRDLFDIVMSIVLLGCALGARKVSPFYSKHAAWVLCGTLLTLATVCTFSSLFYPGIAEHLAIVASIAGGIGIALMILIWSELYGCMNPMRVAFYYSGSIIVGALMIYIYRGFAIPWLFVMTSILPIFSLLCAARSFNVLPGDNLPSTTWAKFSVPWKIIILMAIYAFAYGLLEKYLYAGTFGPHSALGTVAAALVVMVGVVLQGKNFDFGTIYRTALPLMAGALIIPSALGLFDSFWGNFCATGGYTAFSILIMLILANICYRYGVSAIWLFGIERGVRALFMMSDATSMRASTPSLPHPSTATLCLRASPFSPSSAARSSCSRNASWQAAGARSSSMPKTAATPLKKGMRSSIAAMPSRKKKAYRRASKKFCCCSHNTKRFPISKMSSS